MDMWTAIDALRTERVADPEAFVRQHASDAQLLSSHFVTRDFISQVKAFVSGSVEKNGWSDVKV